MLDIRQIPVLSDNFIYLVREPVSNTVAVVDPAVAGPVMDEANRLGWKITHILNTHHHPDPLQNSDPNSLTLCARRNRSRTTSSV